MLLLHHLVKKYHKVPVLDIPLFELQRGIYWLQGANGSGKSTLLKMIAGLIPFQGEILLNGISLQKSSVPYKSQVSYHPADPALPPYITGLELIRFYDTIRNKNQSTEADKIVEQFQLSEFVQNKTGSYSSGMQKRLSLALAFIGKPKLILLDEPLSTLDTAITQLITDKIAEAYAGGASFIITSHQDFEYKNLHFTKVLQLAQHQIQVVS